MKVKYSYYTHPSSKILIYELDKKAIDFSESEKNLCSYYYLVDLIHRMNQLNHRNEDIFQKELQWVLLDFPVKNMGEIHYGNYFNSINDFKKYIREEYGLLNPNQIKMQWIWSCFILLSILGFIIGLPMLFPFLGLGLGISMGNSQEKKAREKGLVLGYRK